LTPLLGGYLCDRYLGNRRSIFIGGIMMAVGQFLLFMCASSLGTPAMAQTLLWAGLTVLIVGNGFFKPNISTMVGQLYPKGDRRVDSAFTIFYMGINLGAFFSPLVCGGLGDTGNIADFKWGFLAACIGMVVSVISFEVLKNKYLQGPDGDHIGMPVKKIDATSFGIIVGSTALIFFLLSFKNMFQSDIDLIGYLIYGAMVIVPLVIITDKSLTGEERSRIGVIFILAFFVIFFWSAFEQAGASLTLFADKQTDRHIGGWEMPASFFQSVNPLAVITIAPIMTVIWGWLHKRNAEPASPLKMAWGLALLCLGYIVIMMAVKGVDSSIKISMFWLLSLYVLHSIGELCLSPIGLSMVSKLAPVRFASLLMGTWFLANAAANKFAGTLSALIPGGEDGTGGATSFFGYQITNLYDFFMLFVVMTGIAAALLFLISGYLRKMMHGIK
jgi:POT family proton-dependent oligopeptide transporter